MALLGAGLVSLPSVTQADESTNAVLSTLSATTISGYVDTSAQWNMGTGNAITPNYAFSKGKADGFNLNVVKVTLEKASEGGDYWTAGYKVDLLAGPDANALATASTLATGSSDFAVKQAYVSLHAPILNGFDFKVGVFDTMMGYEVFESVNNPNFTRSYGYTMEPTTHTGIAATYQFCEYFSASAAVVDTFGSQINQRSDVESFKAYMGSMTLTAPKDWGWLAGSTLSGTIMNGFNQTALNSSTAAHQISYYVGASVNTPLKGLKVGASYDYAGWPSQDRTLNITPEAGYANAVGLYASYQATEKLSFHARGEYASSDVRSTFVATEVVATTATIQYDLWKNVMSRVEFRWDYAADGSTPYGGSNPSNGNKNSYILLANLAYKF